MVLSGEFPDKKSLERNITRGEIARIVIRALKNEKYPSNLNDYKKLIKDYNSTSSKYQEYILKAYALGIVSGGPSGDFAAGDTTTRAAASKIILNMIDPSMRTLPTLNTKTVGGFKVPTQTEFTVIVPEDKRFDAAFMIDFMMDDVDKQITDIASILSQKCDKTTVDQFVQHVKKKKNRFDRLPEKVIYDKKSQRYVIIDESLVEEINIYYSSTKYKK